MTQATLKKVVKDALVETIRESPGVLKDAVVEIVEDLALAAAIRKGRRSKRVSRAQVMRTLGIGRQ